MGQPARHRVRHRAHARRPLDGPKAPQEVVVRPDGRVAYVSCDSSRKVAVIDLEAQKVDKLIDAGPLADGLAWASAR